MITYEQQKALVSQGLATVKTDGIFDTFKYARKVMYENLWQKHPDTMYCRGHVYDNRNGNLVQNPPTKSFNYLENGWWSDVPLDTNIRAYKKYNGFMAAATFYENELVVSTTGTTNSDYAKLAQQKIKEYNDSKVNPLTWVSVGMTNVYEIVDESDPHIVDEKPGVYFLGDSLTREDSKFHSEFMPAGEYIECTLNEILNHVKNETHEGYMVYIPTNNHRIPMEVCKVKTPYYVYKKKLMRMSAKNVDALFEKPFAVLDSFDQRWFAIGMKITDIYGRDFWKSLTDQQRRAVIEEIYAGT